MLDLTQTGTASITVQRDGKVLSSHTSWHRAVTSAVAAARTPGGLVEIVTAQRVRVTVTGDQPTPEPDPAPEPLGFSDGTHAIGLRGDPNYAGTLKSGAAFTPDQAHAYNAFYRALTNPDADPYTSITSRLGHPDTYHLGRGGQMVQVPALLAFRRSGDLRVLDALTTGWELARANLRTTWDLNRVRDGDGAVSTMARYSWDGNRWVDTNPSLGDPWSPYPKWLNLSDGTGAGTDVNNLQNIKPWAILLEYVWALEQNRGLPSPAGFDYGRLADAWHEPVVGLIRAFSEDTDAAWAQNYRGVDGGIGYGRYRARAQEGVWPILVRGEDHGIYNSVLLHHYLGLLGQTGRWPEIPDPDGAHEAARDVLEFVHARLVPSIDRHGRPALVFGNPKNDVVTSATYTNYIAWEIQHIVDTGWWPHLFTADARVKLARSFEEMHNPDGSTKGNIASGVDRAGHGWDVTRGSDRSQYQNAIKGLCAPLMWEEGAELSEVARVVQEGSGGGYDAPRTHLIPAAEFVRAARDETGQSP